MSVAVSATSVKSFHRKVQHMVDIIWFLSADRKTNWHLYSNLLIAVSATVGTIHKSQFIKLYARWCMLYVGKKENASLLSVHLSCIHNIAYYIKVFITA